jgi:hypothetical protein
LITYLFMIGKLISSISIVLLLAFKRLETLILIWNFMDITQCHNCSDRIVCGQY